MFCFLVLFSSCTDERSEDVFSISFNVTQKNNYFFVNNINRIQCITATVQNVEGKQIAREIVWTTNLPKGTEIVSTDKAFSFDLDSLDVLGDYWIKGTVRGTEICETYSFSLISKNSLSNSLNYSFITDISVEELEKDGEGNITLLKAVEYDENGVRIKTEEARMSLNNTLDYKATGYNGILISARENTWFGKLEAVADSEKIKSIPIGQNQILIYCSSVSEEKSETVNLEIKAGSKDSKQMIINLKNPDKKLVPPVFSTPYNDENEGILVSVTGDSVSNDKYFVKDGNELKIDVYRKSCEAYFAVQSENELIETQLNKEELEQDGYKEYNWRENERTEFVEYGETLHLKHAGTYIISAKVQSSAPDKTSSVITKKITVLPFVPEEKVYTGSYNVPEIPLKDRTDWDNLTNGSDVPQDYLYSCVVDNFYSEGNLAVIVRQIKADNSCCYSYHVIEAGKNEKFEFNESGSYKIYVLRYSSLSGRGTQISNIKRDADKNITEIQTIDELEELDSGTVMTDEFEISDFKINDSILEVNNNVVPLKENEIDIYNVRLKSNLILPDTARVFVALYKDGVFEGTRDITVSDWEVANNDSKKYTFKTYIYFSDNHVSSKVQEYGTDVAILSQNTAIKIRTDNEVQKKRNERNVEITATKDAKGTERETYYVWDKKNPSEQDWQRVVFENSKAYPSVSGQGEHTLYVKVYPTQDEIQQNIYDKREVIQSFTVKLDKLGYPQTHCKVVLNLFNGYVKLWANRDLTNLPDAYVCVSGNNKQVPQSFDDNNDHYAYYTVKPLLDNYDTHTISAYNWRYGYIDSDKTYCDDIGTTKNLDRTNQTVYHGFGW